MVGIMFCLSALLFWIVGKMGFELMFQVIECLLFHDSFDGGL